jgi:hypothetical protein
VLDRIMRSLGYVPQVVLTDIHNHSVRLDTDLAAADLEISRLRREAERAAKHQNTVLSLRDSTIADLKEACRNYERMTKDVARLVSVYVLTVPASKKVMLNLAGIDKNGVSVSVSIRSLMLNKKNRDELNAEAERLAAAFGILNSTIPEAHAIPV